MSTVQSLKQRIRDGEVVVALRPPITIGRAQLEAALSKGKYDLIYIDGQHTAFSDDQLVTLCGMAEELGVPVQFRIPHTRLTFLIGRFLDLGLSAILVPEVVDPATVDEAIAYAYYPPVGKRSWGGVARYGLQQAGRRLGTAEYAEWWNQHVVLSVQIESIEAVENARALAKPGIDYLAFGPNDLTFDLQRHPEYRFRTADDCMQYVADQVRGSGIRLGMAVITEPEERQKYLDMGLTMFQETPRP
ncbi:MAG: aldolase/citrate lyase family protein [Chloroflexota bacterium]|nr:aldolase/citrate lyase family protein [Chloroflexota bacterium]